MTKYEELYLLSKNALEKEIERYRRIEEKSLRYLPLLSFILALLGFSSKFILSEFIPPKCLLDWLSFILALLIFIFIFLAFIFIFVSLKISTLIIFPMNEDVINFFRNNKYIDIIFAFTKGNIKAIEKNRELVEAKIRKMQLGYYFIYYSIIFVLFFLILIVIRILL